jgi:serine/threonine-protein phosphatase CPPED1
MRQFIPGIATLGVLAGILTLSRSESASNNLATDDPNAIKAESGTKNPWSNLKVNNDPEQFQFAVVADRTGGHREKVFGRAMSQINLLQPQFVMSVGDLIEGFNDDANTIKNEWKEFDGYVKTLDMPFFYVPGNHDLANKEQIEVWTQRYGKRNYHFIYKDVLFLCINMENMNSGIIEGPDQKSAINTLNANNGVRWTFVFIHRPIWNVNNPNLNGWAPIEKALAGRKYNVFVGHNHTYQVYERNGTQYYQLATTGGESLVRGPEYREFDHIALVTMKKDKPIVAQIMLNGVLPGDLKAPESKEPAMAYWGPPKKHAQPLYGKLLVDGVDTKDVAAMTVAFFARDGQTGKFEQVADGLTDYRGHFRLSTFSRFDGCPIGEYRVTVAKTGKGYYDGDVPKNAIPKQYTDPNTSPLDVKIKAGTNEVTLEVNTK